MKPHQHHQKCYPNGIKRSIFKIRGDTLIEILVTFFIISVGVLGASSMQIAALQNLNGSSYRDQAVIITENLAEEIRAVAAATPNNAVINLRNSVMTTYNQRINNLPAGTLNILGTTTVGAPAGSVNIPGNVTLTVRWDEDRSGSTGTNCDPATALSTDLDCHQIIFTP